MSGDKWVENSFTSCMNFIKGRTWLGSWSDLRFVSLFFDTQLLSFFFSGFTFLYYHYIAAGRLANGPIFICFLSLAVSRGRSTFSACYLRIRVTKVLFYHRKNVKSYFQLIMQKYWVLQHAPAVLLCPFHQLWLGPLLRVLQSPSVSNLF